MSSKFFQHSIARILQALMAFGALKLMTTLLSEREMGIFFLLQAVSSGVFMVTQNACLDFIRRHSFDWKSRSFIPQRLKQVFFLMLIPIGVGFPMLYSVQSLIPLADLTPLKMAVLVSLQILALGMSGIYNNLYNSLGNYKAYFSVLLTTAALNILCSVALVQMFGFTGDLWFLGMIASNALAGAVGYIYSKFHYPHASNVPDPFDHKSFLKFATPIAASNIFIWILMQGYRIPTERIVGLEGLATLGLGLGIAASLTIYFEYLVNQLVFPLFYSPLENNDLDTCKKNWINIMEFYVLVGALFALFLTFTSPFLINILAHKAMMDAASFLAIGAWIEFVRFLGFGINLINHAKNTTIRATISYAIGAVVLILSLTIGFQHWDFFVLMPASILLAQSAALLSLVAYSWSDIKSMTIKLSKKHLVWIGFATLMTLAFFLTQFHDSLIFSLALVSVFGLSFLLILQYFYKNLTNEINPTSK